MKVKPWTMDCGPSTNKGIALLMMLIMISSLMGVIMLCSFVLSHEVNKDERYEITRQRMLEVKRALIGRLADVGGGEDITSCGGFISDYGEPNDMSDNFIDRLINDPGWQDWHYEPTPPLYPNDYQFWAGYRGESYLEANAQDVSGTPIFIDGWGYPITVRFIDDVDDNKIELKSKGSDNLWDTDPGADTTYYGKDIVDTFYWRRPVRLNNTDPAAPSDFRIIYSFQGGLSFDDENIPFGVPATFDNPPGSPIYVPIGLRKIERRNGPGGPVVSITMVCIPPGENAYPVMIE